MKKILLACSILFAAYQNLNAQCTPNPLLTEPGIYPDTIENLPPAFEGASYQTVLQLRVLTDTTVVQGNVTVSNITVNSVSGMPAGFTYLFNPANGVFPGGSNGCVLLSGNPPIGSAGTYLVTVNSTLNGLLFGFIPVSQAFTTVGYKIIIHPKPVPNFSGTPLTICKGSSVLFTDASSDLPSTWSWSFAGGTPATATTSSPMVTYNTAGTYSVTLTVGNPAGNNTLTKTAYVTVNALPTSKITLLSNDTICAGDTAMLTANAGTGLTYQWRLGMNDIAGATSKNYNTTMPGTYKVTVTNSSGCSKLSAGTKIVKYVPAAAVTPAGTISFCAGSSATLTANAGAGLSYKWKKNGANIAGAVNQTYVVTVAGKYKTVVTNSFGCTKASNTVTVTVPCREDGSAFESNGYALYPNPANENAYLDFNLEALAQVTVTIYDLTGRAVSEIAQQDFDAGNYQLILYTAELNNGIYFVQVNTRNEKQTLKLNVKH